MEENLLFAGNGEVEMTGVLVRFGDEWTFQFELDDGTIIRADQSWPSQGEANDALMAYARHVGCRIFTRQ